MTALAAPRERPIQEIRAEFPGLAEGLAMLDRAAGTQVPRAVIDAVAAL
jgi:selenocysteine lyase/cysteine desulfurase